MTSTVPRLVPTQRHGHVDSSVTAMHATTTNHYYTTTLHYYLQTRHLALPDMHYAGSHRQTKIEDHLEQRLG